MASNFTEKGVDPFKSADSFESNKNLALIDKNKLNDERVLFLNDLKHQLGSNNLARQFFTLGLLEYVCKILNPKEPAAAQTKYKGKYSISVKLQAFKNVKYKLLIVKTQHSKKI